MLCKMLQAMQAKQTPHLPWKAHLDVLVQMHMFVLWFKPQLLQPFVPVGRTDTQNPWSALHGG